MCPDLRVPWIRENLGQRRQAGSRIGQCPFNFLGRPTHVWVGLSLLLVLAPNASSQTIYPAPPSPAQGEINYGNPAYQMVPSLYHTVEVSSDNGHTYQSVFVYVADKANKHPQVDFAPFAINPQIPLKIRVTETGTPSTSCEVLPLSKGITVASVSSSGSGSTAVSTAVFSLTRPGQYSVEFGSDGASTIPLLLFVDPPVRPCPAPSGSGVLYQPVPGNHYDLSFENVTRVPGDVIYFAPGVYYLYDHMNGSIPNTGTAHSQDGQGSLYVAKGVTVYLAPGAVVFGRILDNNQGNLTGLQILGPGILDGEKVNQTRGSGFPDQYDWLVHFYADNCVIDGPCLINSRWYVLDTYGKNRMLHNVKILAQGNGNNDGCPVGDNSVLEDSFVMVSDDSIKFESSNAYARRDVVWQLSNGAAFQTDWNVGSSGKSGYYVCDSDVIHFEGGSGANDSVFDSMHGDQTVGALNGPVSNVVFDHVRIDTPPSYTWHYRVYGVNTPPGSSNISHLLFRNISSSPTKYANLFQGLDPYTLNGYNLPAVYIDDVKLTNCTYGGKLVQQATDTNISVGPYVTNLNFASAVPVDVIGGTVTNWDAGAITGALTIHLPSAAIVTQYLVGSSLALASMDPSDWQFLGSNDGTSWTVLGDQNYESFPARNQTNTYYVANNTAYSYYRIQVTANNGNASDLQIGSFNLQELVEPTSTPLNLAAAAGDGQVSLSWASSAQADNYIVKRSTVSGSGWVAIAAPTATTYVDNSIVDGTTYYYVISAVNRAGESLDSSQVSATPNDGIPDSWRMTYFGTSTIIPGVSGPNDTPAHDGVPNLLKYATGNSPLVFEHNPVTSIGYAGQGPAFSFIRLNPATLTYQVETTSDLTNANGWSVLATLAPGATQWVTTGNVIVTESSQASATYQVTVTYPLANSVKAQFFRLSVH